MQKDSIEALHQNRDPLVQEADEAGLSSLARVCRNPHSKIIEEVTADALKMPKVFTVQRCNEHRGQRTMSALCRWLPSLLLHLPQERLCQCMTQPLLLADRANSHCVRLSSVCNVYIVAKRYLCLSDKLSEEANSK